MGGDRATREVTKPHFDDHGFSTNKGDVNSQPHGILLDPRQA